jgi:hypothetical protein
VFIGQIQDIWGLRNYAVKDVVDDYRTANSMDKGTDKGKGKAEERGHSSMGRMYIGKKPPRFTARPLPTFPSIRPSPSIADGSELSDLTSISASSPKNWPEPAVGESAHFGYDPMPTEVQKQEVDGVVPSPELGLSPGRMEMAIALGLGALQFPN